MRNQIVLMSLLLCAAVPVEAQVSVSIGLPSVRIGINVPVYPQLVRVPGYPVYYAPDEDWNYFFYDGMYWVYQDDYWYASSWYNGPWDMIEPDFVPLFVLRVPVRYYRRPPMYFRGWQPDRPPHWDDHWGNDWSRRRSGWDHWDRRAAPRPAPLPTYQRQYSRDRYPPADRQPVLHNQNYRYQPSDPLVRQREQSQRGQRAPVAAPARPEARQDRQERNSAPRDSERNQAPQPSRQSPPETRRDAPREQRQPEQRYEQRQQPAPARRGPDAAPQSNEAPQRSKRGQNPEQDAEDRHDDDRGRGHK